MRVLVVEDTPDSADLACRLIRALGSECCWAATGQQALELAREYHPQIVLLDIGLPDIDGYTVATGLRSSLRSASVKIVALSGYQPDPKRVRESGIDEYWLKPINLDRMKQLLGG